MLGSRFDLTETMVELADRDAAAGDLALSDQCAELEQQMAEMARRLHSLNPRTSFRCPVCDSRMQLSPGQIVSEFAALGIEQHALECDTCGLTTERAYHAAHGWTEALPR